MGISVGKFCIIFLIDINHKFSSQAEAVDIALSRLPMNFFHLFRLLPIKAVSFFRNKGMIIDSSLALRMTRICCFIQKIPSISYTLLYLLHTRY